MSTNLLQIFCSVIIFYMVLRFLPKALLFSVLCVIMIIEGTFKYVKTMLVSIYKALDEEMR